MPLTQLYTPIREEGSVDVRLKRSAPPQSTDGPSSKRRVPREVSVDLGFHSQAAGSCLFNLGATKALVVVQGPRPISGSGVDSSSSESLERGKLVCEVSLAPGAAQDGHALYRADTDPKANAPRGEAGCAELAERLTAALQPAVRLEALPKCAVYVYVVLLNAGGGELSASICGASLALADAGVPLNGLVACCTAVQPSIEGEPDEECVLDPPIAHGDGVAGAVSLAMMFVGRPPVVPQSGILTAEEVAAEAVEVAEAANQDEWSEAVALFSQVGQLSGPQLRAAFACTKSGCRQIHAVMAEALSREAATGAQV